MPDFIAANIATASAAYRHLRERILPRAGLPEFTPELMRDWSWPGRFELIQAEDKPGVLVDGAHNAQALEALVRGLQSDKRTQEQGRSHTLFLCGYQDSRRAFGDTSSPSGAQSISVHPQSTGVFSSRTFDKPLKNMKFSTLYMKALSF